MKESEKKKSEGNEKSKSQPSLNVEKRMANEMEIHSDKESDRGEMEKRRKSNQRGRNYIENVEEIIEIESDVDMENQNKGRRAIEIQSVDELRLEKHLIQIISSDFFGKDI